MKKVYDHFATKKELVMHLIADKWNKSMVQVDIDYKPHEPLYAQLTKLIETEIELVSGQEYLGFVRVALGYFFYHPEELKNTVDKLKAQEAPSHHWLKPEVDDGKSKSLDVEVAVSQLHNLVKGSCFWSQWLKMEPVFDSKQKTHLATQTVSLFLSHRQT